MYGSSQSLNKIRKLQTVVRLLSIVVKYMFLEDYKMTKTKNTVSPKYENCQHAVSLDIENRIRENVYIKTIIVQIWQKLAV